MSPTETADGMPPEHDVVHLRIGVSELRRRPGNRQHVERDVPVGELATSTAAIPSPGTVHLDVDMESMIDGIVVAGTVDVPWTGDCRRCLEPTSGHVVAEVSEVFTDDHGDDVTFAIEGDAIDVGPLAHDAAVLALPLAPLCAEDCAGPAPSEFPVGTADDDAETPADPRWAALSELRFDSDPPGSLG